MKDFTWLFSLLAIGAGSYLFTILLMFKIFEEQDDDDEE